MYVRTLQAARYQAQANANTFEEPFVLFRDTAGNLRVERRTTGPHPHMIIETYYPQHKETVFAEHECQRSED